MRLLARRLATGTGAAILLGAGSISSIIASDEPTRPDPDNPALVLRGKAVYDRDCASCHGARLEGQPNWRERLPNGRLPAPPHDATGHTWHHGDRQLFEMIKNGTAGTLPGYETDMPAYQGRLGDADIWAVLSYIASTWPPDIRARQQRMNRRER
jgi:mono/diheme cytochrome c family protein